MFRPSRLIIPRGDLRQRTGRLLGVTRAHPFLQLLVLADALSAQLVPVRALLFSTAL
jgi:hypothetical protein